MTVTSGVTAYPIEAVTWILDRLPKLEASIAWDKEHGHSCEENLTAAELEYLCLLDLRDFCLSVRRVQLIVGSSTTGG